MLVLFEVEGYPPVEFVITVMTVVIELSIGLSLPAIEVWLSISQVKSEACKNLSQEMLCRKSDKVMRRMNRDIV